MKSAAGLVALLFVVTAAAGCDSPTAPNAPVAAQNEVVSESVEAPKAAMPTCPFRQVHDLRASISGGRLLVTGRVDFMMAGFKPQLSLKESGSNKVALDLALVPEAQAGVSDDLRFEQGGVPAVRSGEIWCGETLLTRFDIILAG